MPVVPRGTLHQKSVARKGNRRPISHGKTTAPNSLCSTWNTMPRSHEESSDGTLRRWNLQHGGLVGRATARGCRNHCPPARLQVGEGDGPEPLDPADGSRDRHVECPREGRVVAHDLLRPSLDDHHIFEVQLPTGSAEERNPLSPGFDEGQSNGGIRDPHGQPWNSATRPDVHERKRSPGRKSLKEQQGVDEQISDDGLSGFEGRHPVHPVPSNEEIQILAEQALVGGRSRTGEDRLEGGEQAVDGIGRPSSGHPVSLTVQAFFVALAGAFSFLRLIRSMYFCWAICSTFESVQYKTRPAGRFRNMNVNTTGMNSIIFA